MKASQKALVWDLPTRICHWAFALSLTCCFIFALVFDEHDALFRYHMLFGLLAGATLVFRVLLGVVGSKTAHFSSFPVSPARIRDYFLNILQNRKDSAKYPGNNPGSALAALAMFALVPFILFSGISREGVFSEDLHGALAFTLGGVIVIHLLGLIVHTIRNRENIALAMVTGKKEVDAPIRSESAHSVMGVVILAALLAWGIALFRNYQPAQGSVTLPLFGTTIQLSEAEGREEGRDAKGKHERHKDHDED